MYRLLASVLLFFSTLGTGFAADKAPDFTLKDINGQTHSLSQYSGKVVLVSFWATWCTPCMAEMPQLQKLYEKYASQGFVVLSISTDDARSTSQVKPLVKAKGLTCPVLLDKETTVVSMYNPAKTLPFAVLLDRNGQIAKVHSGYNTGDEVTLEAEIQTLLGTTGSAPAPASP